VIQQKKAPENKGFEITEFRENLMKLKVHNDGPSLRRPSSAASIYSILKDCLDRMPLPRPTGKNNLISILHVI
jgi:hypothetical protein